MWLIFLNYFVYSYTFKHIPDMPKHAFHETQACCYWNKYSDRVMYMELPLKKIMTDRRTNQPTDRPASQPTDGYEES